MMGEARLSLFLGARQPNPGLDAEYRRWRHAQIFGRALGMHDSASGGHPVDLAGPDRLDVPKAVAVLDLALEQVGDGGEADVRMWPHIDAGAGLEGDRSHLIEEDEGADHAALAGGQHAADLEAAEIAHARNDHDVEPCALPRRSPRFLRRLPTH